MQTIKANNRVFTFAKDTYASLTKYCDILVEEGYWKDAECIIGQTVHEVLDLYVQALLIYLGQKGGFTPTEREFILTVPSTNPFQFTLDGCNDEAILAQVPKTAFSPPIILQLCGLRDKQYGSNLTVVMLDGILNILASMSYLDENRNSYVLPFAMQYMEKICGFVNGCTVYGVAMDEKYVFRKMTLDFETLETSRLIFYRDKNRNPEMEKVRISVPAMEAMKKSYEEEQKWKETKKEEKIKEQVEQNHLEALLTELQSLIGLGEVKQEIRSLINLIKVKKLRESKGLPSMEMSYHMVFTGNPGTGKTTVARLVAQIYKELGMLSKGTLVETDRSGLVAGYVGQTALKVKETVEKAIGGVLFIDEAYALSSGIGSNDFGGEAIDTLVKMMEDNRDDLVIIVAGYTDEMKSFLAANPGLVSRFNKFIEFPDYSVKELLEILDGMADKMHIKLTREAKSIIKEYLKNMTDSEMRIFGNARGIRNVFEKMVVNQANRIVKIPDEEITEEQLSEINSKDVKFVT